MLCLSKMDHMIVHTWILQQLWCTQGNRAKLIADAQIPVLIFQGNSKLMPILDAFGEVVRFYCIMNGTHNTYPLYTDEYVSYILLSSLVHKIYIYICLGTTQSWFSWKLGTSKMSFQIEKTWVIPGENHGPSTDSLAIPPVQFVPSTNVMWSIALTHASSMGHCQIVVTQPFQANPESWKKMGISHLTAGLRHARSISDVTQVLQSASRLMYFNVQNPTGHYRRRSSAGGEILPLASENQRDHVTLGCIFFVDHVCKQLGNCNMRFASCCDLHVQIHMGVDGCILPHYILFEIRIDMNMYISISLQMHMRQMISPPKWLPFRLDLSNPAEYSVAESLVLSSVSTVPLVPWSHMSTREHHMSLHIPKRLAEYVDI